ncbi:dimethylamine monooxygenase subunit DmmA family protein [Mesobacillus thioparans]|uniref:dimethylamine monooxygenase subunit DmmA family protein n=1 Tax=Mesobacillus thioparans TaxID=370439 RepID=UPI0039EE649B
MSVSSFKKISRKRKILFIVDSEGAEAFSDLLQQSLSEKIPFDFHIFIEGQEAMLKTWFNTQKMGTYLYISGSAEFVMMVKELAFEAGFSEHEMQIVTRGFLPKKLICCNCHSENEAGDNKHVKCRLCGQELEASNHYSRRLDAYLGYVTIK